MALSPIVVQEKEEDKDDSLVQFYERRSEHPNRSSAICNMKLCEYPKEIQEARERIKILKAQTSEQSEKLSLRITKVTKLKETMEQLEKDVEAVRESTDGVMKKRTMLRRQLMEMGGLEYTLSVLRQSLVHTKVELAERKSKSEGALFVYVIIVVVVLLYSGVGRFPSQASKSKIRFGATFKDQANLRSTGKASKS